MQISIIFSDLYVDVYRGHAPWSFGSTAWGGGAANRAFETCRGTEQNKVTIGQVL